MLFLKKDRRWVFIYGFHTWMPQLAMNGNWMDAIPSLIKCCVGLQTMVTCGRRWLGLDWILSPVPSFSTLFCLFREGQKALARIVHRAITLHKSSLNSLYLGGRNQLQFSKSSPPSPLPHHPTSY